MSEHSRESIKDPYSSHLDNLFEFFSVKGIKVDKLGRSWHELNKSDQFQSVYSIFRLLTNSCGIDFSIEDFKNLRKKPRQLQISLQEQGKNIQNYPLQSLLKSKKIKDFQDFFKTLVLQSEDNPESLSSLLKLVKQLSSSSLRNLRQSCIWMISGLVEGYSKLLKTYLSKIQSQKSSSRSEIQKEHQNTQDRAEFIKAILEDIISNILLVRSNDILQDIRVQVIQILSKLQTSKFSFNLSEHLFELSKDSKAEVRLEVLKTLENLKSEEFFRFKSRILEMCFDKDNKCCIFAIKLCKNPSLNLDISEVNRIKDLLWSENKEIRRAANDFVVFHVFKNALPQTVSETFGGLDQNKCLTIENALIALAEYFRDNSPSLAFAEQFVEMMWHKTSAIRSCDSMCELLLRGGARGSHSASLDLNLKIVLCCFLEAALRFLGKDSKFNEKLNSFSGMLIKKIPDLIGFYFGELNVLRNLVKVLPLLDLKALASNDLRSCFLELLNRISTTFLKVQDWEIMKSCAHAIFKFSDVHYPLRKEGQAELISVLNVISTGNFKKHLPQLSALMKVKDLTEYVDVKLLKTINDLQDVPSEVICHLMFYWQFWLLKKSLEDTTKEHDYLLIRNKSFEILTSVMEKEAYYPSSLEALIYLCEILFHIADDSSLKLKLEFKIEDFIWQAIEKYMIYMYLPTNPEEDSKEAEKVCISVSRIIVKCSEIMNSHLCSSFLGFFGRSKLIRISTIVKQVLQFFKNEDTLSKGLFSDRKFFYSMSFQAILKVICKGEPENVEDMKETCKKLVIFLPNEKNDNSSERFKSFLNEIIEFTFTDPSTLPVLQCLTVFVTKSTMGIKDIEEIYDHVKFYSKGLSRTREHVEAVIKYLKKILKKKEERDEEEEFAEPKTDKKSRKSQAEKEKKNTPKVVSTRKRTRKSIKSSEKAKNKSVEKYVKKKKID
jgi:hypothetical protein